MRVELRGQRYYRGDCGTGSGIFTGPTFVSVSGSEWALWWGHLARQQGSLIYCSPETVGWELGWVTKKSLRPLCTHIRQVTSWEIINSLLLHNINPTCEQLFGHQVVFDIPSLSVQKENMFAHGWLRVICQHWSVCVTQLIAFLSISKQT